jgi:hypothetical protein
MHWIAASLVSALFLGVYELCTKHAVRDNAVVPVLFFSTLTGAAVWVGLLMVQPSSGHIAGDVGHGPAHAGSTCNWCSNRHCGGFVGFYLFRAAAVAWVTHSRDQPAVDAVWRNSDFG